MAVRIALVPLSRISWILTVAVCLIAAVLVLVNGYVGYFGVLLAVGGAAAVNLGNRQAAGRCWLGPWSVASRSRVRAGRRFRGNSQCGPTYSLYPGLQPTSRDGPIRGGAGVSRGAGPGARGG